MPKSRRPVSAFAGVLAGTLLVAWGMPARADCTCRAAGKAYELGQTACLTVGGSPRLARCEMALNNTSWTFLPDACPAVSGLAPFSVAGLAHPAHAHALEPPPSGSADER
jgi:hypothetical protein